MPDVDPVQIVHKILHKPEHHCLGQCEHIVAALDAAGLLATPEMQRLARIGQRAVDEERIEIVGTTATTATAYAHGWNDALARIIGEDGDADKPN